MTPVPWHSRWAITAWPCSKQTHRHVSACCVTFFVTMLMPRPSSTPRRPSSASPVPVPGAQKCPLPPSYATVLAAHRMLMKVEAAAFHADMFRTQREQYGPRLRETIEMGLVIPGVDYLRAQRLRRLFQQEVPQMFQDVDILVTPCHPTPAPRDLGTTGDARFQSPWTHAGVPTITLPTGLSQAGMPLGLQLIAPALEEERLLRAARWCEAALKVTLAPPL